MSMLDRNTEHYGTVESRDYGEDTCDDYVGLQDESPEPWDWCDESVPFLLFLSGHVDLPDMHRCAWCCERSESPLDHPQCDAEIAKGPREPAAERHIIEDPANRRRSDIKMPMARPFDARVNELLGGRPVHKIMGIDRHPNDARVARYIPVEERRGPKSAPKCRRCESAFEPADPAQRYCTAECQNAQKNERQRFYLANRKAARKAAREPK